MSRCIKTVQIVIGGIAFLFLLALPAFAYLADNPEVTWWQAALMACATWTLAAVFVWFVVGFLFWVFERLDP